jgi:hypothetical protein
MSFDACLGLDYEYDDWRLNLRLKLRSFKFTNDRDDGPTVGASCRCLNLLTSMGGTRSKVEGEDRHDLEPEVRARTRDTRFIQVQVAGVATLRPIWSSIAPCAWCCSPEGLWIFG